MDLVDGKVICLVRAKDDAAARARLDDTFDSGDPQLLAHYRSWPPTTSRCSPATRARPTSAWTDATWQRLADTVDLIVDPAALVNHVLPVQPAVRPQRARHRRADPHRADHASIKPFVYVSTIGGRRPDRARPQFTEDADVRVSQRDPQGRRQLRQRLRQQQVGRRSAAARGARPVRSARRRCSAAT